MGKKKGGKKGAKIVDGVATNEMTRDQLIGHLKRVQVTFTTAYSFANCAIYYASLYYRQMELSREREERNFFMLEREKLYALWNLAIEQLSAAKMDVRLSHVQMDEVRNITIITLTMKNLHLSSP
jgi:hypothetical protein